MTQVQQHSIPRKHVLFVTFPAFGHIIPLLELAKNTAQFHQVTFAVGRNKLEEFHKRELISPNDNVQLISLDDNVNTDFDKNITPGVGRINRFVQEMQPAVDALLKSMPIHGSKTSQSASPINIPVDVVICERFCTSICLPVCHELGIPCCIFNASSGSSFGMRLDVTEDTPAVPDGEGTPSNNPVLTETLKRFFINVNGHIQLASAIIINTFLSCDRRGVDSLAAHPKTRHIPVFCVGPIYPPEKMKDETTETLVRKWLDGKKNKSVIYVSFGSISALTPVQTEIMGRALLQTGKRFIYSISKELQTALPEEIRQGIASQFDMEDGLSLCLTWAPQKTILRHPAISVFLSHAGWNSTMESIVGGVPMVAWPMFADQHANGNWIVERKIGVLIPETKMIGSRVVSVEEIIQALEKAKDYRENVVILSKEAERAVAEGGSSQQDFLRLMQLDFPSGK